MLLPARCARFRRRIFTSTTSIGHRMTRFCRDRCTRSGRQQLVDRADSTRSTSANWQTRLRFTNRRCKLAVLRWSPDGKPIGFIEGMMSDEGFHGGDLCTVSAEGGKNTSDRTAARSRSVRCSGQRRTGSSSRSTSGEAALFRNSAWLTMRCAHLEHPGGYSRLRQFSQLPVARDGQ